MNFFKVSKVKVILWFLPYLVCVALNTWASSLTWSEVRQTMPILKNIPQRKGFKTRHIIQYGSQAGFAAMALRQTTALSPRGTLLVALWLVSVDGLKEEVHQVYVPSRIFSMKDVLYNIMGGLVGLALYLLILSIVKKEKL